MRSPTTSFLLAVSILQLVYILLHMPENFFNYFHAQSSSTRFYLLYSIYVSNYCLPCARRCMYVLQLFVSVERLLAVLVPLRARQFLLVRRPRVFILATPLLVFLAHIHVCLKLEVYHATTTGQGNKTTYSYRFTAAYERYPRLFDIVSIVLKSLFVYLSLLLLLVVNVTVLVVLRRYTGRRGQLTTNMDTNVARRREKQMTLTILVSTLIFIALCLPTASNSLVFNVIPGSYGPLIPKHRYLFFFIQKFGSLCFLLAFSTDFFTYIALSSMYQNTLRGMLGRRKEPEMVTYTRRFPRKEEITTSFHVIDSASHI
ncbi:FMRFamide peptide receptor frpr-18-like isoform X2 [Littorina saxatilis]